MTRSTPSIADLQSPASAGDGKERRSAPSVGGAAGGDASAILRAKHEAALEQVGHDGHALCVFQNFFRNALIRRRHDLVQHTAGMIQPVDRLLRGWIPPSPCSSN